MAVVEKLIDVVRFSGTNTTATYTFPTGDEPADGDLVLALLWRGNGNSTGTYDVAASNGMTLVEHYDPSGVFHGIGTLLKLESDGTETGLDFTFNQPTGSELVDGETNQIATIAVLQGADPDSVSVAWGEPNSATWTYPADDLDWNAHSGFNREDHDISATMFPSGDTQAATVGGGSFRNGGIAVSGGNRTTPDLGADESVAGGIATISVSEVGGPVATFTSHSDGDDVRPGDTVGPIVFDIEYNGATLGFYGVTVNNLTDGTSLDSTATGFQPGLDHEFNFPAAQNGATASVFNPPNAFFEEGKQYEYKVRLRDINGDWGPTDTVTLQAWTWETSPTVTFNALVSAAQPPALTPDSDTTPQDTLVTVDVLANDTNLASPVVSIETLPSNGGAVAVGNQIQYQPNVSFAGIDVIGYRVTNADGLFSTSTVTITVSDDEDPAVSINDPGDQPAGTTSLGVSGFATDNVDVVLVEYRLDGGAWATAAGTDVWSATLVGLSDGSTHVLEARASDLAGNASSIMSVSFDVAAVNPPILFGNTAMTTVGAAVDVDVLTNDSNVDPSAAVTVATPPTNGAAVVVAGNLIRYTPDMVFVGNDMFEYQVTNPDGGTAVAPVNVSVLDDTFTTADDNFQLPVGVPFAFQLAANDVAAQGPATYAALGALPDGMVLSSTGVLSGTLTAESQGTVAVVATLPDARQLTSSLGWEARNVTPDDAWLSPIRVAETSDAARLNRALPTIAEWAGANPLTVADLDELASDELSA